MPFQHARLAAKNSHRMPSESCARFDILKEGGYKPPDGTECALAAGGVEHRWLWKEVFSPQQGKSNDAADVCCLYGITPCSKTYTDGPV